MEYDPKEKEVPKEPKRRPALYEAPAKKPGDDGPNRPPSKEKEFIAKRPSRATKPTKQDKFVNDTDFHDKFAG